MKRKAPNVLGAESPVKISKEPTDGSDSHVMNSSGSAETTKDSALMSPRLSSARQRKAPAWLSSYITDGSTAVKDSPKITKSKVPTLTSPQKKKSCKSAQQSVKNEIDGQTEAENEPPSLRRESTLKLDSPPPQLTKNKKSNTLAHSSSLMRKDTEILSPSTSDSGDSSTETKQDIKVADWKPLVPNYLVKSPVSQSSQSSDWTTSPNEALSNTTEVPSKQYITSQSSIHTHGVDAEEFNSSNVVEVCDTKSLTEPDTVSVSVKAANASLKEVVSLEGLEKSAATLEKPKMLEIVICISTSGAMRDYLAVLQEKTRDLVWRLQSLIPDLRIGVLAHTQGGIHDDKNGSRSSAIDHNYIRTGGHSGTKWLDLGATFSQICAFVDSLEPEATIYPDYVQDNLEMALWKLQRCMSWSSCSYRTVVMIGRGRPNSTSFYLQKEHWRGWIRSALEIGHKAEIPIIDWELEAKLLAQMGIHVFTIQASTPKTQTEEEEDEGNLFFRRVAEITNGLQIRLTEVSKLVDIIVGVCCACHGPELLQSHRDNLRDENDGVLPPQLRDIFVSLQLHSKRRSLSTIPSLVGDLNILKSQLAKADANGNISSSEEDEGSGDDGELMSEADDKDVKDGSISLENTSKVVKKVATKSQNAKIAKKSSGKLQKIANKNNSVPVKPGRKTNNLKLQNVKSKTVAKKAVKALKKKPVEQKGAKRLTANKTKADGTVLSGRKKVSNSNIKKKAQKEKDVRQTKVTTKHIEAKIKSSKAVAKVALQKNAKIKAISKSLSAASKNKSKKLQNSKTNHKSGSKTENNS